MNNIISQAGFLCQISRHQWFKKLPLEKRQQLRQRWENIPRKNAVLYVSEYRI